MTRPLPRAARRDVVDLCDEWVTLAADNGLLTGHDDVTTAAAAVLAARALLADSAHDPVVLALARTLNEAMGDDVESAADDPVRMGLMLSAANLCTVLENWLGRGGDPDGDPWEKALSAVRGGLSFAKQAAP